MKRISELVRQHPLNAFFLITFSMSWILWYFAGRYSPTITESDLLEFRYLVTQLGEYAPALVGLIILSFVDLTASAQKWHTTWAIFIPVFALAAVMSLFTEAAILHTAPLIFAAVGVAALVLYVLSPLNRSFRTVFSPQPRQRTSIIWLVLSVILFPVVILIANIPTYYLEGNDAMITLQGGTWDENARYALAVFFMTLLYGGPLGEEPGWRGFALPFLQKRRSPLEATIILGFFWALWHAPLDISHGFVMPGFLGVVFRLIFALPVTFLFTFFYNRTKGSILIAILLHTSANFGFTLFPIQTASSFGVFVGIVIILACYAVFSEKMWLKLPASLEICTEQAGPQA